MKLYSKNSKIESDSLCILIGKDTEYNIHIILTNMPVVLAIVVCIVGVVTVAILVESIYTIGKNLLRNSKPPLSKNEVQLS
mgnify:CR=1 FL=1